MIGRIVGGVLGGAIGRQKGNHSVAGAVIGAGTLFAARRLFPQRYDRAEARLAADAAHAADPKLTAAGVVDPYAGTADEPTDGQTMGDALPPSIPVEANGRSGALH